MSNDISELRRALDASPRNALLRLMLVRKLLDADEISEAMTIAMNLDPGDVSSAGDRELLAGLWKRVGMEERAALFEPCSGDDPSPPSDAPRKPASKPAPGNPVPRGQNLRIVADADRSADSAGNAGSASDRDRLSFNDIGGLDEVKRDIRRRIIVPFAQPSLVARFRKRAGGGVLIYGPPGCGKTLLARATAGECGARFFNTRISEVLDPYSGISERRLSGIFRTARENVPSVLFFDEIDALAAKRASATASHVAQLASHFLSEMDGAETVNEGVLVLAATNTPWSMDPAFLRPGRFDRVFFVPPPDREARECIFSLELSERPVSPAIDLAALANATSGFSGADIRGVVDMATDIALDATLDSGIETEIDQRMLEAAVSESRSTVAEWLATARDYATYANEGGRYNDVLAFLERNTKRR